jgi:excisionase family DNA binding protein
MATADVGNASGADEHTVVAPSDMAAMLRLATFLEQHVEPAGLVGPDGQTVPLPVEVYDILVQVVEAMRSGKAITVTPLEQRLTTQQAAELLGVSRPTLVKLLESHEIPYELPGRHRRVRLADVLEYRDRRRLERRERLAAMTRQAVEDGLYDADSAQYTEALRQARAEQAG